MEFKLILKKLNNTLSEEDATIFREWYNASNLHKDYFNKVKDNYQDDALLIDLEKAWKSIEKQIKPAAVKKTSYLKYAVAASVVLLVSIGQFVYKTTFDKEYITEKALENINPGFEKATLVLADGKEINLEKSKNETIVNSNIAMIKNTTTGLVYKTNGVDSQLKEEVKYNTLYVPIGGIYNIELSDGTKVWLNSASSLKFPIKFIGNLRVVTLEGEAYFDVVKSSKEFIVKTNTADITVLGTKFNVSSYSNDNQFATTLVEGKVKMTGFENSIILNPNQQGFISGINTKIKVKNVETEIFTAWKEGKFYFKKEPLDKILTKMNRWYNVDVLYSDESVKNEIFTGVVLKNKPIDYLLNTLCETTSLKYSIDKNKETQRYEIKIGRK